VLANFPGGFGPYQAWSNCLPFTIFNPPPPPPAQPQKPEIPNVFTPNDDGSNDLFLIKNAETWSTTRMVKIFNRWGNLVFETDTYDNAKAWNGTDQSGRKVADGVYFYVVDFYDQPTGQRFSANGEVTLFGSN
jgi:gliding motility-associated-like protein